MTLNKMSFEVTSQMYFRVELLIESFSLHATNFYISKKLESNEICAANQLNT